MAKVTGRVVELMQGAYPELVDARDHVARAALMEEERFGHTLRVGLRLVESLVEAQKGAGQTVIPGGEIFRLYDTYGFPVDLLRDIATDNALTLDYQARLTLTPAIEDALKRGVPLYFVAQATVYRSRWYWRDERLARVTRAAGGCRTSR